MTGPLYIPLDHTTLHHTPFTQTFLKRLDHGGPHAQATAIAAALRTLGECRATLLAPLSSSIDSNTDDEGERQQQLALVGLANDHARVALALHGLGAAVQSRLLTEAAAEVAVGFGFAAEAAAFAQLGRAALAALAEKLVADAMDDDTAAFTTRLALTWSSPSSSSSPIDAAITPYLTPRLRALQPALADPKNFGRLLSLLLARLGEVYLESFIRASARPLLPAAAAGGGATNGTCFFVFLGW